MAQESWESSLLPPRRSVAPRKVQRCTAIAAVEKDGAAAETVASLAAELKAVARPIAAAGTRRLGERARLCSLEMINFKCFEQRSLAFDSHGCCCIVGPNSSGKSSVFDAINFVTLRTARSLRYLVRRCRPAVASCSVTAVFDTERLGKVTLRREVCLEGPKEHRVSYAVAAGESCLKEVQEAKYASWIDHVLCWKEGVVMMEQFGLIEKSSVSQLLEILPKALDDLKAHDIPQPPLLKRRAAGHSQGIVSHTPSVRTTAEAWLGRRVDEIYRELSREPLDDAWQAWSEGGQACLRRLQDGTFTFLVSQRRGLAALGYGSPLESLSDGDRDLLALALMLALPGLRVASSELQDILPPLVILDEPDSRLDKRRAHCLWQLLCGPGRPAQCLLMSLNNHRAFVKVEGVLKLPELVIKFDATEEEDSNEQNDIYGDAHLTSADARAKRRRL